MSAPIQANGEGGVRCCALVGDTDKSRAPDADSAGSGRGGGTSKAQGDSLNLSCVDDARVAYPLFQAEYGGSTPTSTLQLRIHRMEKARAVKLNALWHSVLPYIPAFHVEIAYGAESGGKCYAVALWGRPVARTICDKGWLELRRMAIADDAPKNTASRMLAIMTREIRKTRPDICRLISYQDTARHKGTIYKAAGWVPVDMSSSPINWGGAAQTKKPPTRERKAIIADAPKVRWEYALRSSGGGGAEHGGENGESKSGACSPTVPSSPTAP